MYEKEDAICFCNNFDEADRENVKFSAAFTKMPAVHRYGGEQRAEHASHITCLFSREYMPKSLSVAPLRLRFLTCTLEKTFCVNGAVI